MFSTSLLWKYISFIIIISLESITYAFCNSKLSDSLIPIINVSGNETIYQSNDPLITQSNTIPIFNTFSKYQNNTVYFQHITNILLSPNY